MSSCLSTLMQSCPNIQGSINAYWNTCGASMPAEPFPFYEWLASEINQNNLIQEISPGQGKTRRVNVVYQKRIQEAEVNSNGANPNCSASTKRGQCVQEYEIDTTANVQAEEYVEIKDLTDACVNNPDYFQNILYRLIDAVDRKNATKSTVQAVALKGKWAGDVANVTSNFLQVKTLKDADPLTLQPFTMQTVKRALEKTGYCAPAAIFGGDQLTDYYERILAACCSASGNNLAEIFAKYGFAAMYDRRVASAMDFSNGNSGADAGLIIQNGALALLHWTISGWKDGLPQLWTEGSNYVSATVISPRTGVPMDLFIKDDCGKISITVTCTTKVVGMPIDIFPVGDLYEGVTFVNGLKVVNV